MKKIVLIALVAFALASTVASAQNAANARQVVVPSTIQHKTPGIPGACSPCLWYAGDSNTANPLWNAHRNDQAIWDGEQSQVWVPFVATSDGNANHKHVKISAVTFNEVSVTPDTNPPADFAGMTFGFRVAMLPGKGGTLLKNASCPSTVVTYTGVSFNGFNEYSFTCQLGTKAFTATVGTIYWVNLKPKFTVSNVAYLEDAIDVPALNQFGWGDQFWNTFFNSATFSNNYEPAQQDFSGYGEFAVAIAGKYQK